MRDGKGVLLVVANGYPDVRDGRYHCHFVHEQVRLARDAFARIVVVAPQNGAPRWSLRLPILRRFSAMMGFDDYDDGNVRVRYPRTPWLALGPWFPRLKERWWRRAARRTAAREAGADGYRLVHCHFLYPAGLVGAELARAYAVPCVVTVHEGDIRRVLADRRPWMLARLRSALLGAARVVAVGRGSAAALADFCPQAAARIVVLHNVVRTELFRPQPRLAARRGLGWDRRDEVLINVANLVAAKKGQLDLVDAFASIASERPRLRLVLVGDGPDRAAIAARAARRGVADRVLVTGPIANSRLPAWFAAADLFVFPSYHESFGIAQVEAGACGVPVVAYHNDGSDEVVVPSLGELVPTGDVAALAAAIRRRLGTVEPTAAAARRRREVVGRFSPARIRAGLLAVYRAAEKVMAAEHARGRGRRDAPPG